MPVTEINSGREPIKHTIRTAASASGGDFSYLLRQAEIESGLNPDAKAKTSSAMGLFQFTEGTWMRSLQTYGAKHGMTEAANAIGGNKLSGAERAALLDLRRNPEISTRMAAEYAAENARHLQSSGHQAVGPTELYLAHFLGAQGATRFLDGMKTSPDAAAAPALPKAAEANQPIFYPQGKAASYRDIYNRFASRFQNVGAPTTQVAAIAATVVEQSRAPDPSIKSLDFKQAWTRFAAQQASDGYNAAASTPSPMVKSGKSSPSMGLMSGNVGSSVPGIDVKEVDKDVMSKYLTGFAKWNEDPSKTPAKMMNSFGRDASQGARS